jgi:prepilin-type N-terminal cleavage/methylation domain-containing protein/prepilin-type processing-associated H-X9-DG protein
LKEDVLIATAGTAETKADMNTKKAFTLIELLVVISIIALLLAILVPSLQKARSLVQTVVCRSHLKQWGIIFYLYAQDNDQKLPQSIPDPGLDYRMAYWMGATLPYYKDPAIRFCPSCRPDRDNNPKSWVVDDYGLTFEHWGPIGVSTPRTWWDWYPSGSYGINEWCACPPPGVATYWQYLQAREAWRTIDVRKATDIPLFLDCLFVDGAPRDKDEPPKWENQWDGGLDGGWHINAMKMYCFPRHGGGINSVFLDGHARHVGMKELWRLKWHQSYDIHNPQTQPNAVWPDWMNRYD